MLNSAKTHFYRVATTRLIYIVGQLQTTSVLGEGEMGEMIAYLTIIGNSKDILEEDIWVVRGHIKGIAEKLGEQPEHKALHELAVEVVDDLTRRTNQIQHSTASFDQLTSSATRH